MQGRPISARTSMMAPSIPNSPSAATKQPCSKSSIRPRLTASCSALPGSFQRDDTAQVSSVEIVQRGRIKELDGGTLKTGDNTQQKVSMANTYYKVTVDGEELVEIDLINMIWKVGGEDLMEEHRKAIGL